MRRVMLLISAVGVVFGAVAGSAAAASSVYLCVPSTAGASVTSGGSTGTCSTGTPVALPSEKVEQEKLISILPDIKYEASGIDSKPTIQFSGVNLQVIDGAGSETTVNGAGNLILGYDEKPKAQTGSHNFLLGGPENSYYSYGGIVGGGHSNTISGPYASVLDGAENTATGISSIITDGHSNKTTDTYASINGGCGNYTGTGTYVVSATCTNTTYTGYFASILGGTGNQASGENSTVSGGGSGEASGVNASITGGSHGKAGYRASTVLGGLEEVTQAEYEVTP
jgi:hypothetical protein